MRKVKVKNYVAIPTWVFTRMLVPFLPVAHPWYGRRFTLEDWASHQTTLCRTFDFALWVWLPAMVAGGIWLFTK